MTTRYSFLRSTFCLLSSAALCSASLPPASAARDSAASGGIFAGRVPNGDYVLAVTSTDLVDVPGGMVHVTPPAPESPFNISRERITSVLYRRFQAHPAGDELRVSRTDALAFAAWASSASGRALTLPSRQQLSAALPRAQKDPFEPSAYGVFAGSAPADEWTIDQSSPEDAIALKPFRLAENSPRRWLLAADDQNDAASNNQVRLPARASVVATTVTTTAPTLPPVPTPTARLVPEFTVQPLSQPALMGSTVTFTAVAVASNEPTYQWYFNGELIAGATSPLLVLSNVQPSAAGAYQVVASNTVLASGDTPEHSETFVYPAYSEFAVLRVIQPGETGEPPRIVEQPISRTVASDANVSFTVRVTGTPPFAIAMDWTFGSLSGPPLALPSRFPKLNFEGDTATLQFTNVEPAHAGDYKLKITNAYGAVTSNLATLRVIVGGRAPSIAAQPTGASIARGASATFAVTASGNPEPSYQWNFNGAPIAGATSTSFSISNAQTANAGSYTVTVKNELGETTSAAATLNVTAPAASSNSGGGGGGAPSLPFVLAAGWLFLIRWTHRRSTY